MLSDLAVDHLNRGTEHLKEARFHEAIASYDRVLRDDPVEPDALRWKGDALRELKRLDEAAECYETALKIKPDDHVSIWHLAMTRLLQGDYERGWKLYESRWDVFPQHKLKTGVHAWRGESLESKSILLWAEQGFGDTIQFYRYAMIVAGMGAAVTLRVQPALQRLLMSQGWPGVTVISERDEIPKTDFQCPLLSLPFVMGMNGPLKYASYLSAPEKITLPPGRKIGLCWSGNRDAAKERHRSATLEALRPIFACNAKFYGLQAKYSHDDEDCNLMDGIKRYHLRDFADTASLISSLDLVISVDTSVAHLAGAMGKPVWTLIPYVGTCWRWMTERTDSPWYPSMTLFRQKRPGVWHDVVADVAARLNSQAMAA